MFIIDLRNALVSEYRFSVMDNENVDKVGIISQFTQYSDYSIYLKVESDDRTYVDKIAIANEDVSVEDGALVVKWTMGRVSTQCKQINLQLQFEKEIEGKQYTAQSRIVSLTLRDTINVDEEMSHVYPKILEDLRHDIDQEHATNETQQEEINANKEKLQGIEEGAQVNVIEHVIINGTEVQPVEKAVSFSVPTQTSQLENNSDFTTKTYVDNAIAEIEMRSDVVDVVGTYADLEAYDTSHLAPNSLIKVINDETHDHEITYYRWVVVDNVGSWVYVASEGAFYTTAQIDQMLLDYFKKNADLEPSADNTISLGTLLKAFKDLYLKGKIFNANFIVNDGTNDVFIIDSVNSQIKSLFSFLPTSNNLNDLGNSTYKWRDLFLAHNLNDGANAFTISHVMGLFNLSKTDTGNEIRWSRLLTFSKSADTTFTFETAKTTCLSEYKAIITNSGASAINLTFTGVNVIKTNDDTIGITNNVMSLPSGITIEINVMNNNMIAINWNA